MGETDVHRLQNQDNQRVTNTGIMQLTEGTGPISTATNMSTETFKSLKRIG